MPSYMSSNDKPTAAFVLSLIGGIFIVLGGIVEAAIGSFFYPFFLWSNRCGSCSRCCWDHLGSRNYSRKRTNKF